MANLNRDLTLLIYIRKYCKEVSETIENFGKDFETFKRNHIYQNAVSMAILQIGELANHLSDEYTKETNYKINWNDIRGMRNRFAHEYEQMDINIIYDVAINDIPFLCEFASMEIERLNDKV